MSRSSYHHGDLAPALEAAAMALLAEQPAGSISLREVARRAGVSHNAPYHHFGDRTQLLKVLAERSLAELVAAERAVGARDDLSPLARAREFATVYLDFALDRPHAFAAIYDPTICIPGAPTATMAPLIDEIEALLAQLAADLRPELSGAALAEFAAALWGLAHGLAELGRAGHLSAEASRAALTRAIDDLVAPKVTHG